MPVPTLASPNGYLPVGDHTVTWTEITAGFGHNQRRRQLLEELFVVLQALKQRGVQTVWLDGSFVTAAELPRDIDVVYEAPEGADVAGWGYLSPLRRVELRNLTGIDLWLGPAIGRHGGGPISSIKDFFSTDRDSIGRGLLLLRLQKDFP
ncbi:DUF6932 family protein [Streptomyces sp. NPDC058612]|uniref:DUF6932 family protein n=1 Tax=Streptomyces sp. NPDC058612 TaxID=3346555 RepID=UPI0036516818